jgi:glutaredoxin
MPIKINKNLIVVIIVIIAIIAIAFLYQKGQFKGIGQNASSRQVAEKAIEYINKNILAGGGTASLVGVSEVNGVLKISLKIGEQSYDSYITKDGKLLFPESYDLEEKTQATTTGESQQTKKTCEDLKKGDAPSLEAFVVSQCPYGLQMQRILNEIVKNIPSYAKNIEVKYMGSIEGGKITSMHGDEEAQENLRQICIREEEAIKYWSYVDCHIKKGDVESCLASAGVDTQKLSACMSDNTRGLKYAKEDFDSQEKYQVTGSPSLFLNGENVSEFDFGGRNAEAVKNMLCCGFNTKSDVCSQKLNESQAATGFSATYTQSSGSSSGSCE